MQGYFDKGTNCTRQENECDESVERLSGPNDHALVSVGTLSVEVKLISSSVVSYFEFDVFISPPAARITSTEAHKFIDAMTPPAMMSGQPDPVIEMNTADTTVRTLSIASFRSESQMARIDASPPRK